MDLEIEGLIKMFNGVLKEMLFMKSFPVQTNKKKKKPFIRLKLF